MAIIVVTRLRLKDPALLDDFFTDALAAIEQAQKSDGNLGVDAADTQTLGVATRIAALGPVTIGGFVLDDHASSDHSGFEAEQIAKITAAGQTLPVQERISVLTDAGRQFRSST